MTSYLRRLRRSYLHRYMTMDDELKDELFTPVEVGTGEVSREEEAAGGAGPGGDAVTGLNTVAKRCHARDIVDFKWAMYGEAGFVWELVLHCALLMLFTTQTYFVVRHPIDGRELFADVHPLSVIPAICFVGTLVLLARLLYRESVQARYNGILQHFADIWNLFDLVQLGIVVAAEVLFVLNDGRESAAQTNLRTVAAIAAFIIWAQLLFYLRAFKATGKFVSMIIAMCIDIKFFILILGIFILASGATLFASQSEVSRSGFFFWWVCNSK